LKLMIDLNILTRPDSNKAVHEAITKVYHATHQPGTEYTPADIEQLTADALKDHPLADLAAHTTARLIHSQLFSMMILGPQIGEVLQDSHLDRDEFIFALAYLGAALTYVDSSKVRQGNRPISKRDFIRLTTAAYELMQIHGRNIERTDEQTSPKDH